MSREAVIVSTARTPIGRAYRGAFNDTPAPALAAHALNAEAYADQRRWLAGHIGIDPEKYATDK